MSRGSQVSSAEITAVVVDVDTLPVISVLRILLGIISTTGNLFILYLFYFFPRLRNNAYSNLVGLLSLSNFLVGTGLLIRGIFTAVASAQGITKYDKGTCYAVNSLIGIGKTASEIVILGIAIERLKAVYNPVSYGNRRQDAFIISIFFIAVAMCIILTYGKQVGVDRSVSITVCTAGMATGPYTFFLSTVYSGVFLIVLYSVYLVSLVLLAKMRSSSIVMTGGNNQFKSQVRMFIQFFLVMLNYMVFYGIPFAFSLLTLIFTFPPSVKSAITLFAGLSAGCNATLDCLIYMSKHEEIKQCILKTLLKSCPSFKSGLTVTVNGATTLPSKF